jgi:collagen type VII alpha
MANEFIARKGLIISGSSFKAESTAIPSGGTSNEVVVLELDGFLKTKTNASSSGSSGSSGTSGANGSSGSSGTSGANGSSGSSGTSGTSGANGSSGSSGTSGTSGANGSSGSSGSSGTSGANGSSGSSGTSGANGSSGSSGTSGANGSSGSSGTSGADGSSGSSGTSGADGSSGSSGANGSSGSSGTSGANGSSGSSGTSGANGSSGSSGTSGANGSSGSSGTSGANGSSGSSGTSGANGSSGSSGTSGAKGDPGTASEVIDVYDNAGGQTFTTTPITVNLDTTRYNSNGSIFTLSNDEITVNTDIRALIIFRVSIGIGSGTARSTSTAYIERDTGSGFSEVDGSRIFMYNRTLDNGDQTGTGQLVLDVSSGDKFRIRAVRNTGSDTLETIADGSGLTITDLMGGEAGPSGAAGSSGTSGANGSSGSSGTSGANGSSGSSGTSGANGANGSSGSSGTSGANGANGSSGSSGSSGASGANGANGSSGSSGTSGANGANGSSGSSGTSGANGANGSSGSSGTSGANGANGSSGSSGSSGTSGANGANGSSGSSGTSGANGANGSSGSSGTSGANGANGSSGSSGTSGANGSSGSSGTSGLSGDSYATTSSTSITIGTGTKVFTVSSGLSYTTAQSVVVAYDGSNYMEGSVTSYVGTTLTVDVTSTTGSGTYASWDINLAGAPGPAGSSGSSGTSGANGSSGSSGTSGTSFAGSITGTTSNGILTYVNATNNLAVESNLTYNGSTDVLTLLGQVDFTNQAGTYLTSKNGGAPGEWFTFLGNSGDATGWLSVSETFGITGSIGGETFTFDDTNGFELSTDLTSQGIIYARDGIRSIASGTGTAGYSNQFWSLSGETETFVILDSDGEETFRVTGSLASRNYKIEFGDLAGSEEGNKFVLEDEFNKVYATNNANDILFGVNTDNPEYTLDVDGPARFSNREYTTYTPGSADASIGDIIRIGTGTTVAGKTYHFDGTGWNQTNANPASNPATSGSLVAIALGTSPTGNGMLIRGIAYPATISGMSGGKTVYFDSTDGTLTISPPSTSNYIVRIAGHALSSTTIYFNPSPDWLIVA